MIVTHSANRKLGAAAAHYRPLSACPDSCALRSNGCYAERGFVRRWANAPEDLAADCAAIRALPLKRPLRLLVSGDATTPIAQRLSAAVRTWGGTAWGYTHRWRTTPRTSWDGVAIRASCDSAAEVTQAHARGYQQTALVVDHFESPRRDSRGIPCPEQTGLAKSCSECGLCWRQTRKPILFQRH